MSATTHVGLFGKTPQLGDFVERRIHPAFRQLWDEWLQEGIAESQRSLGEAWLDVYLTSPVWRFALSARLCGMTVYAGVLVPSVDRVGRYFPLTIVAALPPETSCIGLLTAGHSWFLEAEAILLSALENRIADVDELDSAVNSLQVSLTALCEQLDRWPPVDVNQNLVMPLRSANDLAPRLTDLCECFLAQRGGAPTTYWLTQGSARVSPRFLTIGGLPDARHFAPMLHGELDPSEWQQIPPRQGALPPPVVSGIVSSVRTDRGHVRAANEDCAAARPDMGLWAVADGMGGYSDGALASAAVCTALEAVVWSGDLSARVSLATAALRAVNDDLRRNSRAREQPISSASTVMVLLIHGDDCACIWAGDSRLYRLREGSLEQISTDHAVGERPTVNSPDNTHRLTAGIGVGDELHVDVAYGKALAGDRFLLCSDGVHETVDAGALAQALAQPNAATAAYTLISQVLTGSATDNATAVMVFVP